MKKGVTVLSLFDGMSCGQLALERAGIKVKTYYASEVDKYAIQVTQHNFPKTIQLGDVTKLKIKVKKKYIIIKTGDGKKYKIKGKMILIGGSPCQGFSFAGKMVGASTKCNIEITTLKQYLKLKKEGFEFEGQSYLFWEYIRILRSINPEYFFLENVMMVQKWKTMFNEALGIEPIQINSALVSAQNRKRLYWTNIPGVEQPKDKGLFIKDILEDSVDEKYYLSEKQVAMFEKLSEKYKYKYPNTKNGNGFTFNPIQDGNTKAKTLTDEGKLRITQNYVINQICKIHPSGRGVNGNVYSVEVKSNTLTSVQKDNYLLIPEATRLRKLTPKECERLQTVPDNYTSIVSNSQRYKMLGNGWTVDVPAHIFKGIML